ncbi:MAG: CDP-glycerol glycerophosphotransferase family protein [Muribaculaceae bacterium]|nr:CDP-glycerol glycerophosphotransferase family protein [Muribaculaceae bacterium]
MLHKIKYCIGKVLSKLILLTTHKEQNLITFIPHGGCETDGYNFINYKSDSALTMFRYIADKYGDQYSYQISAGDNEIVTLQEKAKEKFPHLNIKIIPHPLITKRISTVIKSIAQSGHIFSSQALPLDYAVKGQNIYYLGYYAGNFKNDFVEKYKTNSNLYNLTQKIFFSPSLLFSQLNSIVYNSPLSKFVITGLVRNDNLLKKYDCPSLDKWLDSAVDYNVKKIFLYTPTHRDYEQHVSSERNILGFPIDKHNLESFLEKNQCVIIVKLHSIQNRKVISSDLPKGIILYQSSKEFGLTELLQKADFLISDYTSTYYDFLLLDRPVLFNFYDFDRYKATRGFSFDPIEPILAGEIFTDQKSMIEMMGKVLKEDRFKEKRHFVRDLIFKYKDDKAAERVYNYIFND